MRTVAQRDLSLLVSFNKGVFILRPLLPQCEPLHTRPEQQPDCFRPPPTAVSLETMVEGLLDPIQPLCPRFEQRAAFAHIDNYLLLAPRVKGSRGEQDGQGERSKYRCPSSPLHRWERKTRVINVSEPGQVNTYLTVFWSQPAPTNEEGADAIDALAPIYDMLDTKPYMWLPLEKVKQEVYNWKLDRHHNKAYNKKRRGACGDPSVDLATKVLTKT